MSTLDPAVYRRAAEVIATGGLTKRAYGPTEATPRARNLPHCTVGALRMATGLLLTNFDQETQFLGHLLGLPPEPDLNGNTNVTGWNDRPVTTEADVIGLLIEAAEKLEAEQ